MPNSPTGADQCLDRLCREILAEGAYHRFVVVIHGVKTARKGICMAHLFSAHLARFGPDSEYSAPDLAAARSYCARLTRSHYENFTVVSALLPRRLVPHFQAIYAYCRWADDLGDETGGGQKTLDLLGWWRQQLLDCFDGRVHHPVMVALRPTIELFAIPTEPFLDLLAAFEQDQHVTRYVDFESLLDYCRLSANPVGRIVLYLCDSFNRQTAALADHISTGLQLANFWQDVGRDFEELGRVYLPERDCERFGYCDDDLKARRFTPAFQDLMCFQVNRARGFLERGRPLLDLIPTNVRVDVELFLEGGLAILKKIEAIEFNVWKTRPKLAKRRKAQLLLRALAGKTGFGRRTLGNRRQSESTNHSSSPTSKRSSYEYCRHLTRVSARNFDYAFRVLPRVQRESMNALYAFMRVTDDLADTPGESESKRVALKEWGRQLDRALAGAYSHPLHAALHDTVSQHGVPSRYLHEVINGVTVDLQPKGFSTFDELYHYCYRVASSVGLACIHIWGFEDEEAKEYAEAAGIALQLTNILRDLGEDLDDGRIYLPERDLESFECMPEIWRQRGAPFRRMMAFQVERARGYYRKAEPLAKLLSPSGRAVFQVMMRIYRGLLEEIERRDYDVFTRRVRLSRWRKMRTMLMAFPIRWGWL